MKDKEIYTEKMRANKSLTHMLASDTSHIKSPSEEFKRIKSVYDKEVIQSLKKECWLKDINRIEETLSKALEAAPKSIDTKNLRLFIKSHLAYVKANNGNATFKPYLERLRQLEIKIINNNNKI